MSYMLTCNCARYGHPAYWNLDQEWQSWLDSDVEFFETKEEAQQAMEDLFDDGMIQAYNIQVQPFA